jgi:transcription antitermination factor NusG
MGDSLNSCAEPEKETKVWVAIQTAPRREKSVEAMLIYKGYNCLLPRYITQRRWSGRVKSVDLALFPSYLFCQISDSAGGLIVTTPGVTRIVTAGNRPIPIPDSQIQALKTLTRTITCTPHPYLATGNRVRVTSGLFVGVEGILTRFKNRQKLIISVDCIMRSVAVEVSARDVELLASNW